MRANRVNWNKIIVVVCIMSFVSIMTFFAYYGITHWQLKKSLDERGVITTAKIIECASSQNTSSFVFEYDVPTGNGDSKTYQTKSIGGGRSTDGCKKGKKIKIKYLPEAPEKALSSKSSHISMSLIGFILICFVLLSILYEHIKNK